MDTHEPEAEEDGQGAAQGLAQHKEGHVLVPHQRVGHKVLQVIHHRIDGGQQRPSPSGLAVPLVVDAAHRKTGLKRPRVP